MSSNEFMSFMISYFITYVIMLFVDKKIRISGFVRVKLNINTKAKLIWSSAAAALLVGILMWIILGSGSDYRSISAGMSLGVITAISNGISSVVVKRRSSVQK